MKKKNFTRYSKYNKEYKTIDFANKIRYFAASNPNILRTEIAKKFNTTKSYVSQVLNEKLHWDNFVEEENDEEFYMTVYEEFEFIKDFLFYDDELIFSNYKKFKYFECVEISTSTIAFNILKYDQSCCNFVIDSLKNIAEENDDIYFDVENNYFEIIKKIPDTCLLPSSWVV